MSTRNYISYRAEYKYQLAQPYQIHTSVILSKVIDTEFVHLHENGLLIIKSGYAWDGPSGPVRDKPEYMRGSLVHDALYQLMRHNMLDMVKHRKAADILFKEICKEDGVSPFIAIAHYFILRRFGQLFASPEKKNRVKYAPKKNI